jgi:hypothetical protein
MKQNCGYFIIRLELRPGTAFRGIFHGLPGRLQDKTRYKLNTVMPILSSSSEYFVLPFLSQNLSIQNYNKYEMNGARSTQGRHEKRVERPVGRPRYRWEDNIKMDLREIGREVWPRTAISGGFL